MNNDEAPRFDSTSQGTPVVLCVGDLGWKEERKCDLRFFLHYPAAQFVHVGINPPKFGLDRLISLDEAKQRFLAGKYAVVVVGSIPSPFLNPRKGWLHRWSGYIGRSLQIPAVWEAIRAQAMLPLFAQKLVGIDLEDRPILDNKWFAAASHCRLFFKRELPQNPANAFLYTTDKNEDNGNIARQPFFADLIAKLRPISIGVESTILARGQSLQREKTADVFFAGRVANRPNRAVGMRQLERLREEGFRVDTPETKLSRPEFHERCAASYTVWSPEGFGYDCTRTYEAAALGSVPILQYPTIHRYAPLVEGRHAIYYGVEEGGLYRVLANWLSRPEELLEMGRNAQSLVAEHHTFGQLARYIVETSLAAFSSESPRRTV